MNRVLIYSPKTSERLTYIFDFILGDLLGLEYDLTNDKDAFIACTGPRFSYAPNWVDNELFFESAPVLFETDISLQPVDFIEYENMIGFYLVSKQSQSDLPFDMFASSFVMISRYNEYLLHKKDKYDRYRASQSMNFVAGFLEKPMVNYYALHLKKMLVARFPQLKFKQHKFEYLASFDVDMAYSYLGKGFKVNLGGFVRSLFMSNFKDLKDRYQVLFRNKKDPFDTFDELLAICKKYGVKTKFFFQVGNRSTLDKNVSHTYEPFKEIIKKVAKQSDIGIHLSFMSHISEGVMEEEIRRLEFIAERKITSNRFHYLRFTLPASYVSLSRIGITEDYTFGYATRIGFRAATCSPFYFFNLLKNERSNVKIYPFAFMDSTLAHYNKQKAYDAQEKILQMMQYVKQVEGPFIGLWHNSSFTEDGVWKGWKSVFETIAKEAAALTEKSE
jgi:hypothetical protein